MAPSAEPIFMRVDKSGRVVIPLPLCSSVNWITGSKPIKAWLLMGRPGRYRLLSEDEFESNSELQILLSRSRSTSDDTEEGLLVFKDDALDVAALRLVQIQLSPPNPGWRLSLPKVITGIMNVRPGLDDVAFLYLEGRIEIWAAETLRQALSVPITEIL